MLSQHEKLCLTCSMSLRISAVSSASSAFTVIARMFNLHLYSLAPTHQTIYAYGELGKAPVQQLGFDEALTWKDLIPNVCSHCFAHTSETHYNRSVSLLPLMLSLTLVLFPDLLKLLAPCLPLNTTSLATSTNATAKHTNNTHRPTIYLPIFLPRPLQQQARILRAALIASDLAGTAWYGTLPTYTC